MSDYYHSPPPLEHEGNAYQRRHMEDAAQRGDEAGLDLWRLQSIGAEQCVLASALLEPRAAAAVMPRVEPQYFYREAHRVIFEAMQAVHGRGFPIDLITVCAELRERGELEDVGGPTYLTALLGELPTAAHVNAYIAILEDRLEKRLVYLLRKDESLPGLTIDDMQASLEAMRGKRQWGSGAKSMGEFNLTEGLEAYLDQRNGDPENRPHFDIPSIDRITGGLPVPGYSVLMGDAGMGKSTVLLQVVHEWAVTHRQPTLVYSAEMDVEHQLGPRLAQVGAGPNADKEALHAALYRTTAAPLRVCDDSPMTIEEITSDAKRANEEQAVSLVAVDYHSLIGTSLGPQRERERLVHVSAQLKNLSKIVRAHVMVLSQVTWTPDRDDANPFGSRGGEMDADVVLEIRRDGKTAFERRGSKTGMLYVRKQRMGPVGACEVYFDGCRFLEAQHGGTYQQDARYGGGQ